MAEKQRALALIKPLFPKVVDIIWEESSYKLGITDVFSLRIVIIFDVGKSFYLFYRYDSYPDDPSAEWHAFSNDGIILDYDEKKVAAISVCNLFTHLIENVFKNVTYKSKIIKQIARCRYTLKNCYFYLHTDLCSFQCNF